MVMMGNHEELVYQSEEGDREVACGPGGPPYVGMAEREQKPLHNCRGSEWGVGDCRGLECKRESD